LLFPSSKAVFLEAEGKVPEIGTVLRQPDLARTFRLLAEQGPKVFYEGEIARDIVAAVRKSPVKPGHMSLGDLQAYRAVYRQPTRFTYRGHEIVSMPPPSSGGISLGLMLGMLEPTPIKDVPAGSLEETDLLARISNTAFADRNAYLGDQDWSPQIPMHDLLSYDYIERRRAAALQATPGQIMKPGLLPRFDTPAGQGSKTEGRNTTHYSIVDADRNVVACTTTIENGMGCGLIVPGRGFLLNNQLTDFDLDHTQGPNALDPSRKTRRTALADAELAAGRQDDKAGAARAGKRPRSSMTPVIVFKDGQPYLTAGSPGGPWIIGIVEQLLINVLDHGMDMQQAINAPRVNSRNSPIAIEVLHPHRAELQQALRARGWAVEKLSPGYEVWGGAQGIRIRPDGRLEGGADPRREGAVRGF
jgi:gamma-glutamyltranspeptidase/glutathione hydrolase